MYNNERLQTLKAVESTAKMLYQNYSPALLVRPLVDKAHNCTYKHVNINHIHIE